jgi:transcriptional regulator with XRE-family HTH domain
MATKIEPFYEDLGSKIQQAREHRKMTQAQLGLSLKPPSTRASIANIENGKQRVLVHTLAQLADSLSVKVQMLIPAVAGPSPKDVEKELKRKLNLDAPQLKKLAARLSGTPSGNRS